MSVCGSIRAVPNERQTVLDKHLNFLDSERIVKNSQLRCIIDNLNARLQQGTSLKVRCQECSEYKED